MHKIHGPDVVPAGSIFTGEGGTLVGHEIDFHRSQLLAESERERRAGPREGLRQRLGHVLIAMGRAVHGLEPEVHGRTVLHQH